MSEIKEVASELFEDADNIAWIDLSFNELSKLDDVSGDANSVHSLSDGLY